MRKTLARTLTGLTVIATGLAAVPAVADPELPGGTRIGPALTYAQLTVLPLYGTDAGRDEEFLVLDEGMDKGLVKIVERGEGGSVNQLVIHNTSDRPLFVMSGEVIVGGQQDRIIGKDTVIPPKKRKEVEVFCVEHGRWSGSDKSFRSAKALAHTKLRKQASYGGQGQVWDEVAKKNAARGTENGTDTYRRIATEEKTGKDVRAYEESIGAGLARAAEKDRLIGVAVAVNGEVVAIEEFASAKLFAKVRPKLLRSYYVEALDVPAKKTDKPVVAADVVAFAGKQATASKDTVLEAETVNTLRISGQGYKGTEVMPAAAPEDGAPAKPVYKSWHKE